MRENVTQSNFMFCVTYKVWARGKKARRGQVRISSWGGGEESVRQVSTGERRGNEKGGGGARGEERTSERKREERR